MFDWLTTFTLTITVALVIIGLVQWILRSQSARLRYQLWNWSILAFLMFAIISLLPAFTIIIPTLFSPSHTLERRFYPQYDAPAMNSTSLSSDMVTSPPSSDATPIITSTTTPQSTSNIVEQPVPTTVSQVLLQTIILIIWSSACLSVIARYVYTTIRLRRDIDTNQPLSPTWQQSLDVICQKLQIHPPKLYSSTTVPVPIVFGMLSPTVVIPVKLAQITKAQQELILLHECLHIKHRDLPLQLLALVFYALQWFNPLVWVLRREIKVLREQACDEYVLSYGIEQQSYARYLIDIARNVLHYHRPTVTAFFTSKSNLSRRIEGIISYRASSSSFVNHILKTAFIVTISIILIGQVQMTLRAQSARVLTLAVPESIANNRTTLDTVLSDFEAQYTDVNVQVVTIPRIFGSTSDENAITTYQTAIQNYAESGDVFMVETATLNPVANRAGYLLDLNAIAQGDTSLTPSDYHPAAWDAFQWDGGLWAMPTTLSPVGILYDQQAFDNANLPYPSADWTLADFERTALALTTETAGFQVNNSLGYLAYSLTGTPFTDSTIPAQPSLILPDLAQLAEAFATSINQNSIAQFNPTNNNTFLLGGWSLRSVNSSDIPLSFAPLPNGRVAVEARGYAVSSGTPYPQLAYELSKFLSTRSEIVSNFAELPALSTPNIAQPPRLSDADITQMTQLLDTYIPTRDLLFSDIFDEAVMVISDGVDSVSALQTASTNIANALITVSTTSNPVVLQTPIPQFSESQNTQGEILTFAVDPSTGNDISLWQEQFEAFVTSDVRIGEVDLVFPPDTPDDISNQREAVLNADCGYIRSPINYQSELDRFLDLSPFINSDFTFNPDDLVDGNLEATTAPDGRIYMLPASIEPFVIGYDPALFEANNVPLPIFDWTLSDWTNSLQDFVNAPNYDDIVVSPQAFSTDITMIELLITLYGGRLYTEDGRSLNLDDPATDSAVREIIALAQADILEYIPLYSFRQDFTVTRNSPLIISVLSDQTTTDNGATINSGILGNNSIGARPYNIVPFPQGTTQTPYGYDVTGLFISATSEFAEPCYRLIRQLQQQPVLFGGLPPLKSLMENPAIIALTPSDLLDFYSQWIQRIGNPDAVRVSTLSQRNFTQYAIGLLLGRALDRIILDGGSIDAELLLAQEIANQVSTCAGDFDPSNEEDAFNALRDCFNAADPSLFGE
ncbi:MAG: extracellular solute-binding protein [Chloroflexota bacterium]